MTRYIQGDDGKMRGSIGDGRDDIPQPRLMVVPMTPKQAESMQSLANALATLKMHPDYADAVDALVNAADHCDECGARLGYGVPYNYTKDADLAHACATCLDGRPTCEVCGRRTNSWLDEPAFAHAGYDPATWPGRQVTVMCTYCARHFE